MKMDGDKGWKGYCTMCGKLSVALCSECINNEIRLRESSAIRKERKRFIELAETLTLEQIIAVLKMELEGENKDD